MSQFTLILDNIRSNYNVGSLLRTADSAGISAIFACGTTPYPTQKGDPRDPVAAHSNTRQIAKTALGAEAHVAVNYHPTAADAIEELKKAGWHIYALEQAPGSADLFEFKPQFPAAIVLGNEVGGISAEILEQCDAILQIPQHGAKESLNVSVAGGIAVYQFRRQMVG